MKGSVLIAILTTALLVIVSVFVFRKARANKLRTQLETAKKNFPFKDYDSVYAEVDTVRFYKNGSYIGMSVTATD